MNEELLDETIKKAFKTKLNKPDGYIEILENALNTQNEVYNTNKTNIIKKVACILLLLLITTTTTIFGTEISNFIKQYLLKTNSSDGIKEAIDNGYIEEIEMQYVNSNDINIKVNEILMDDFNLAILFDLENLQNENIYGIELKNFIITDEQNNIIALTLENSDEYQKFYKEKNIEKTSGNIAFNNGAYYGEIVTKYDKKLEYKYITYSDGFPKSKKLFIMFNKIVVNMFDGKKVIEGDWKFEVELPEKMYNRESSLYSVKEDNNNDIIITKFEVSNTETKVELVTKWGEPVYTSKDSEEEKNRKIEEFFDNCHKNIVIQNEYIENSNGEKFYPVVNSSDNNGGYNQMFSGDLRYWQTFNLTKYNASDELKLVLEKQGEIIEIKLKNK